MTDDLDGVRARLRSAGATEDELGALETLEDAYQLSGDLGIRPNGDQLSLRELATATGVGLDRIQMLIRAAGLPADDIEARLWYSSDVDWLRTADAARLLLGDDAVFALMHRSGAAMSQLANAASSAFRVNLISPEIENPLAVVERNLAARALIETLVDALSQLFRYHTRMSFREDSVAAGSYGEMRTMAVGFVDLASSTELGGRVTASDLAGLISDFNTAAFATATSHGVRVVKTIGDEVMLCALDANPVCRAALELVEYCTNHDAFSAARGGVALGQVLEQDGDCYGPVVNRASRFVEAAPDGAVMVDDGVRSAITGELMASAREPVEHRGLGAVAWSEVSARGAAARR